MRGEEYTTKFLELLRYVLYLTYEKAKVQRFVSGVPLAFRDGIEYDEPRSLEEFIGKLKHCYEQSKRKNESQHGWKGKYKGRGKWRPNRTRPQHADGEENVAPQKRFNAARQGYGPQQQRKQHRGEDTGQLECWTCGEEHLRRDCLSYQGGRPKMYSAQEAQTVGNVGQSIPRIYGAVDNGQTKHQAFIIEMDDKICDQVISILIDPRSNYSYVIPNLVDKCGLNKESHAESWFLQLPTGTKKRVHHWARACAFDLNAIECVDDNGEPRILQGKKKATSVRMVATMQVKFSRRKGCKLFDIHISSDKGKEVEDADIFNRYPMLQQLKDVFAEDITKLPPHREVDFSIELVPWAALALKTSYRMSTLELVELKLPLKEMLDKGYIRPSVSPWGAPMLIVRKKDGTLRLWINYR
eukprot:PITA_06366